MQLPLIALPILRTPGWSIEPGLYELLLLVGGTVILVGAVLLSIQRGRPFSASLAYLLVAFGFILLTMLNASYQTTSVGLTWTLFLLALVMCASLMPVERLPSASWQTAMGLGFVAGAHLYPLRTRAMALGIGAGQMSRVDASRIAVMKAQDQGRDLSGAALASDAFFPFADGLLALADAGAAILVPLTLGPLIAAGRQRAP